jgi:hypothetical protein
MGEYQLAGDRSPATQGFPTRQSSGGFGACIPVVSWGVTEGGLGVPQPGLVKEIPYRTGMTSPETAGFRHPGDRAAVDQK